MKGKKKGSGRFHSISTTVKKNADQLSEGEPSMNKPIEEYERELDKLHVQIRSMEEELRQLRLSRGQLEQAYRQNEKLTTTLHEARAQIEALRSEVDKLSAPPSGYGIFSASNSDGTVNVYVSGRKMKVNLHPSINGKDLRKGQELILNEALNVGVLESFQQVTCQNQGILERNLFFPG